MLSGPYRNLSILPHKNRSLRISTVSNRDFASQAISFEILDATGDAAAAGRNLLSEDLIVKASAGTSIDIDDSDPAGLSAVVRKFVTETVGVSLVTPGCLLDTTNVVNPLDSQVNSNDKAGKSGVIGKGKKGASYAATPAAKQNSGEQEGGGGNSGSNNNFNKGGSGFINTATATTTTNAKAANTGSG